MKLGRIETVVLCGLSVLTGHLARADTVNTGVSTATETSLYDKISEKAALTYFGVYRGAPVGDPLNSLQPNTAGALDPTSPQSIESYVTAGYRLDKDTVLGVVGHFMYFPIGNPVGAGQSIQNLDPSILLSRANLINVDGFRLKGMIYGELPLSSSDLLSRQNQATSIAPTFSMSYDVPHTDLTVGLYGYIKGYIPTAATIPGALTYKIYAAPNANYQLTKTLAATLWFDFVQVTRTTGTGFISGMKNDVMDIEPGISWDISKYISINPVLNIYPSNLTLAATSIQAIIIGKAF